MISRLLLSRSLLTQFLVFNFLIFTILSFFTFLYLKAIEPELISQRSSQHLKVIKNIEANLNIQKTSIDSKSLKEFLTRSKFLLDEVDQIRFLNKEKKVLFDSVFLDLEEGVFSQSLKIEQLSLKNQIKEEEKLTKEIPRKEFFNENFFQLQISKLNENNNFSASEVVKKNFIVHTFQIFC